MTFLGQATAQTPQPYQSFNEDMLFINTFFFDTILYKQPLSFI